MSRYSIRRSGQGYDHFERKDSRREEEGEEVGNFVVVVVVVEPSLVDVVFGP